MSPRVIYNMATTLHCAKLTDVHMYMTDVSPAFEHHNISNYYFSTNKVRNKAKSLKIN